MMTISKENMISMISQWFTWSFLKFLTSVQTRQESEMCCNYSLLLKEFGTIIWKFVCTYELEKRVLSYYSLQNFCMVMWKFAWLCELVQRLKTTAVTHISFAPSCENFAWSCEMIQRLIFLHFQSYEKLPYF